MSLIGNSQSAQGNSAKASIGTLILNRWNFLNRLPLGKFLFAQLLGQNIPYTGSIGARVQTLKPGYAEVNLRDRRSVRNHLGSIHAIALANLAELTTGLATLSGMPNNARGILVGLDVKYLKKARGTITGTCSSDIPSTNEEKEYIVEVSLQDKEGSEVVKAKATWLIGPIKIHEPPQK